MPDNNVNIRVELARDNSGKLTLMAYFSEKAPNFAKDNEGYYWIPTVEEKDFLNDAFGLMPGVKIKSSPEKPVDMSKEEPEIKEVKESVEQPEPTIEPPKAIPEEKEPTPPVEKEIKAEEIPPVEKEQDDKVFEVTGDKQKPNEKDQEKDDKAEEEVLVKADEAAIEAAIKKKEEKDKSMVEVDEQTIIDKVLSQKKKGKWRKN